MNLKLKNIIPKAFSGNLENFDGNSRAKQNKIGAEFSQCFYLEYDVSFPGYN